MSAQVGAVEQLTDGNLRVRLRGGEDLDGLQNLRAVTTDGRPVEIADVTRAGFGAGSRSVTLVLRGWTESMRLHARVPSSVRKETFDFSLRIGLGL